MDSIWVSTRLKELRMDRKESARQMSIALGQNPNYINHVEIGKAQPSMGMFLCICDYFHITPHDFFDEGNPHPECLIELMEELKKLEAGTVENIARLIQELINSQHK